MLTLCVKFSSSQRIEWYLGTGKVQRLYEALVQPTDESMAAWLERVAPGCTSRFDEDVGLERAFDSDGDEELHEELQALFDESDESLAVDEADIMSIMSD